MSDQPQKARRPLFWLGLAAILWAVLVLQAGGFTTSIRAGMAFLDWPLSNGSVNPPGWLTEIDKFAEHSHRLAATGLGLFCIALAVAHWLSEPRRWVRRAAYALLGLVVLQGCLGGLRVLLDQLNIGGEGNLKAVGFAVAHAVNAQLTIALLSMVTLSHTRTWHEAPESLPTGLRRLGLVAIGLTFGVILAGAVMRQGHLTTWVTGGATADLFVPAGTGAGWWINACHRMGALAAASAVVLFALWSALIRAGRGRWMPLTILITIQLLLGVLSIRLPLNPHVRTVHLVTGAALFSALCATVMLAHRKEGFLSKS